MKAQAYISTALLKMNSHTAAQDMLKWFGKNDAATRFEVMRVLNGVRDMLNNVDYEYPGDQCSPHTYAYVYPSGSLSRNSQNQYVVFLCDVYMKVDEGEKIETLTHEGSHHMSMNTDDVPFHGHTAYGRSTCKEMASECQQLNQGCLLARRNADSYCYFINDAAGHGMNGR